MIIYKCNKYPEEIFRMEEVKKGWCLTPPSRKTKNNKGNTIKRNVDGREKPVHSITVENLNKEPHDKIKYMYTLIRFN